MQQRNFYHLILHPLILEASSPCHRPRPCARDYMSSHFLLLRSQRLWDPAQQALVLLPMTTPRSRYIDQVLAGSHVHCSHICMSVSSSHQQSSQLQLCAEFTFPPPVEKRCTMHLRVLSSMNPDVSLCSLRTVQGLVVMELITPHFINFAKMPV